MTAIPRPNRGSCGLQTWLLGWVCCICRDPRGHAWTWLSSPAGQHKPFWGTASSSPLLPGRSPLPRRQRGQATGPLASDWASLEHAETNGMQDAPGFEQETGPDQQGDGQFPFEGTQMGDLIVVDPKDVENMPGPPSWMATPEMNVSFVDMFRDSAPYIRMHRGTTAVIHIPGQFLERGGKTMERDGGSQELMDELALLSLLGVKLVLVLGCRPQIDAMLARKGLKGGAIKNNMRVTDEEQLRIVKEAAGFIRFEVESALSRGRDGKDFVPVIGGNFYSAQPVGVRDGVDYGFTGEVRRIETKRIQSRLDAGDIVQLTCLGYSPSGEMFNLDSEQLAAVCAARLGASKLVYVTDGERLKDASTGYLAQTLRLSDAAAFVRKHRERGLEGMDKGDRSMFHLLRHCVTALESGVKRAHLVPPYPGALSQELFSREGAGTLICGDVYDSIRRPTPADLPRIQGLVETAYQESAGNGVMRNGTDVGSLGRNSNGSLVFTRDDKIVGCAGLRKWRDSPTAAEIRYLVVDPLYRQGGIGQAMLGYMERMAIASGVTSLYLLCNSVHTQWFAERGFKPVPVEALPESRRSTYDWTEKSKVYMKQLKGYREVDAEELFWNIEPPKS